MRGLSRIKSGAIQIEELSNRRNRKFLKGYKRSFLRFFLSAVLLAKLFLLLFTTSFSFLAYLPMVYKGSRFQNILSPKSPIRNEVQKNAQLLQNSKSRWSCSTSRGLGIFVNAKRNLKPRTKVIGTNISKELNKGHHRNIYYSKDLIPRRPTLDKHITVSYLDKNSLYCFSGKINFFSSTLSPRKMQAMKFLRYGHGNENMDQKKDGELDDRESRSSSSGIYNKKKLKKIKKPEKSRKNVGKVKGVDWFNDQNFYSYKNFNQIPTSERNKYPFSSHLEGTNKQFTVLGIESSCDDTGVAIVRSDGKILGECIASQNEIHEEWGGVVPGLARDAHAAAINETVATALKAAGMTSVEEVDAIAVTQGPGLEICLRVGLEKAKELAVLHDKPFVCVHHLEAHCLVARLMDTDGQITSDVKTNGLDYPFLALLVSGGHCLLLEVRGLADFVILGGTLDDALGEAYDKAARLIGITKGVAGGAILESFAREGNPYAITLPVPLKGKKNLDLSYSGLKNALRMAIDKEIKTVIKARQNSIRWKIREFIKNIVTKVRNIVSEKSEIGTSKTIESLSEKTHTRLSKSKKVLNNASDYLSKETQADIAASFQDTALKHLEDRLSKAMDICSKKGIHRLAVVGGVAANQELRSRLLNLCQGKTEEVTAGSNSGETSSTSWELYVPPPKLCTDNGVMVAWAGVEKLKSGYFDSAKDVEVKARWSLGQIYKAKID